MENEYIELQQMPPIINHDLSSPNLNDPLHAPAPDPANPRTRSPALCSARARGTGPGPAPTRTPARGVIPPPSILDQTKNEDTELQRMPPIINHDLSSPNLNDPLHAPAPDPPSPRTRSSPHSSARSPPHFSARARGTGPGPAPAHSPGPAPTTTQNPMALAFLILISTSSTAIMDATNGATTAANGATTAANTAVATINPIPSSDNLPTDTHTPFINILVKEVFGVKSQQELVNQINAGRWAQFIERVIKRLDVYRFMSAVMFGACVVLLGLNTTITHVASYTSLYISFFMLVTCICYNEVVRSAVEGFGCHNIQQPSVTHWAIAAFVSA
ncbi:hypothetical protein BDR04DRAFT_1154430 [Suillus decipiens]|nr:hypothetical protein BDR04DRAFT_1154430 [Suillus decipiens]